MLLKLASLHTPMIELGSIMLSMSAMFKEPIFHNGIDRGKMLEVTLPFMCHQSPT